MKDKAKPPLTATAKRSGLTRSTDNYRTIHQIFQDDYGIQLNPTNAEWWRLEQNPVVNTALLDSKGSDLYYYITAGGSYGSGDVRLPPKNPATGEISVPEGWTGPFTDAVWWDCDINGIVHEFRIYCYAREPYHEAQIRVFLRRNAENPLLFTTQLEPSTPEPETEPETQPAPESEPADEPEPEDNTLPETAFELENEPENQPATDPALQTQPLPQPEQAPTSVPVPPSAPTAKSALREVYETLSPQQLCTVVGLRTLLAKQQGISKKEAKKQLSGVLKALSDIATLSGRSEIYGFGCFKAKTTKIRTVKSHLGGHSGTYTLPKTTKSVFKPGRELKKKMSLVTGKTHEQIITALESLDAVNKAKAAVRKATRRGAKSRRAIAPKAAGKQTGR